MSADVVQLKRRRSYPICKGTARPIRLFWALEEKPIVGCNYIRANNGEASLSAYIGVFKQMIWADYGAVIDIYDAEHGIKICDFKKTLKGLEYLPAKIKVEKP